MTNSPTPAGMTHTQYADHLELRAATTTVRGDRLKAANDHGWAADAYRKAAEDRRLAAEIRIRDDLDTHAALEINPP